MESVFSQKQYCTGCGVCEACCPKDAISMQPDAFGFLHPKINQQLCVDCGICQNVCHMLKGDIERNNPRKVIALRSKNLEVINKCQSGGAFTELARCVLSQGGIVYGAALNEQFCAVHIRIDRIEELFKLQGSKYVQSNTTGIFAKVKADLDAKRTVLFSGTPCQVAALKTYLKREYDNLLTVDVVCHGIMPPRMWSDHMTFIRRKYGDFTEVKFRDKTIQGWRDHWESFQTCNGLKATCTYRQLFYVNYFLRESCYMPEAEKVICKYGGMERCSDLTIGDFWGIENINSDIQDDNTGISICLINSEKGESLLAKISEHVLWEEHTTKDVNTKNRNPHLADGVVYAPEKVNKARREYLDRGYLFVARKYADLGMRGVVQKGKRLIKRFIRRNT